MVKIKSLIMPAVWIMFTILSASCSSDNKAEKEDTSAPESLAESIPADASQIIFADLDALLKAADCQSKHGSFTLSNAVTDYLSQWHEELLPLFAELVRCGDAVDLTNVAVALDDASEHHYLVADRKPQTAFAPNLSGKSTAKSKYLGDVDVYTSGAARMVVSDSRIWLYADCTNAVASIDAVIEKAKQSSVASVEAMNKFFSDKSSPMRIYVADAAKENMFGSHFKGIKATMQLRDRSMSFAGSFVNADFAPVNALSSLTAVDNDYARYIPINTALSVAAGITDDAKEAIFKNISNKMSASDRVIFAMVKSALKDVQGTISVSLAPGGAAETIKDFNLKTWQACVSMSTPSEESTTALHKSLLSMIGMAGMAASPYAGQDRIKTDFGYIYVNKRGKNLLLTTYPFDGGIYGSSAITPSENTSLYMIFDMPYGGQLMKAAKLDFGLKIALEAAGSDFSADVALSGTSGYILPAFLKMATARKSIIESIFGVISTDSSDIVIEDDEYYDFLYE